MRNSGPDTNSSTDEILTRLCKALSAGMDRFEAKGKTYETIIEKHRAAVNTVMFGNGDTPGNRLRMRQEGKIK